MDFKIYEDILDDNIINYILTNINENRYQDGRVGAGARINKNHKNRKDLFINENKLLSVIDDTIYDAIYEDVKLNFSDIKYRERWKLGKYIGDDNGFYKSHRDNSDETAFRSTSMICGLTDPDNYEGGELCFDNLNKSFKIKKGCVVVFKSSLFHHVNPVTKGIRIVLISFFFDDTGKEIKDKLNPICDINHYKPILTNFKIKYDPLNIDKTRLHKITNLITGDVDYSDNKPNEWSDKDDFWFESNNSDTLLVTFAGMGAKDSIPTFIFYNFLKKYNTIDKLYIRDITCRYYLSGLKNNTNTLEETIEFIKNKSTDKKYKKIVAIGCSSGGFAAILFGQILKFDKIIAFSPQTVINNKKLELIGDIYNAPKTCEWLTTRRPDNTLYNECLDLANFKPFHTNIDIHYSVNGNKGIDKKHALYLECSNCSIYEYPGNDHLIALTLRNNGKLTQIIEKDIL